MKTLRTYSDFKRYRFDKKEVAISKEAKALIEESYAFLKDFAENKNHLWREYGLWTDGAISH